MNNPTIEYYNNNAALFVSDTQGVSMTHIHEEFLKLVPGKGPVLDLGCGSGRDSKIFLDLGYEVVSVDGSAEMCKATSALTGKDCVCATFEEYEGDREFAGIWACASLLHLDRPGLIRVLEKYSLMLVEGGCFYMSFKYGDFCGDRGGRFYLDMDEDAFREVVSKIPRLVIECMTVTSDVRPGRECEKWLNCFLRSV